MVRLIVRQRPATLRAGAGRTASACTSARAGVVVDARCVLSRSRLLNRWLYHRAGAGGAGITLIVKGCIVHIGGTTNRAGTSRRAAASSAVVGAGIMLYATCNSSIGSPAVDIGRRSDGGCCIVYRLLSRSRFLLIVGAGQEQAQDKRENDSSAKFHGQLLS